MTELVDPDHCPLCGDENHCGMRAGSKTCWCFSAKLVPGVLDRVPPEAQRVACCCERCATGRSNTQCITERIEMLLRGRR